MKELNDVLPIISLIFEGVLALLAFFGARWLAAMVVNIKLQIDNAILGLENRLNDKYATKDEVDELRKDVNLAGRIDTGFAHLKAILHARETKAAPPS